MRVEQGWFRRERTYRAAEKLNGALETFRVVSAVDNMAGGQIVLLNIAADLCKELGEVQAARALSQRAERVAKSNDEALAKLASRKRRRKPQREPERDEQRASQENHRDDTPIQAGGQRTWQPGSGVPVSVAR